MTVLDINADMLAVGRERAASAASRTASISSRRNAEALPFADDSFDAYTIAFGIRNVPRIEVALAEAFRVLKRGGRFLCLEFSHVDVPGLDRLYEACSFNAIPRIGQLVAGDGAPYAISWNRSASFPQPAAFAAMMRDAGFDRVTCRPITGGIVRAAFGLEALTEASI